MPKKPGHAKGQLNRLAFTQRCVNCGKDFDCTRWDARACGPQCRRKISEMKARGTVPPHRARDEYMARLAFKCRQNAQPTPQPLSGPKPKA